MSGEQTGRRGHRQLVDGLLDAAWLRVQLNPLERYRSRGPFEPAGVAGALGLAPGDLLAQRAAIEHVLGDHAASLDPPVDAIWPDAPRESGLEQTGADASATLISLAVELADAIGERKYVTRGKGLDPLTRDAVLRDLGRLLDERATLQLPGGCGEPGPDHRLGNQPRSQKLRPDRDPGSRARRNRRRGRQDSRQTPLLPEGQVVGNDRCHEQRHDADPDPLPSGEHRPGSGRRGARSL
jgi:hypothetical protein